MQGPAGVGDVVPEAKYPASFVFRKFSKSPLATVSNSSASISLVKIASSTLTVTASALLGQPGLSEFFASGVKRVRVSGILFH